MKGFGKSYVLPSTVTVRALGRGMSMPCISMGCENETSSVRDASFFSITVEVDGMIMPKWASA